MIIEYSKRKKIKLNGFNMSLIRHPKYTNMFLGTMRSVFPNGKNRFPLLYNEIVCVLLDQEYSVISSWKLKDESKIEKEISYTHGLEDYRMINENEGFAVSLYTNREWKPEMCLCTIDKTSIKEIKPLYLRYGRLKTPEKNWLLLREEEENYIMIHSYFPFRVVKVNKETGIVDVLSEQNVFTKVSGEIHGGSCVWIPEKKQYLVLARNVDKHVYKHYYWIQLNEQYSVLSVSQPFRFEAIDGIPNLSNVYEMVLSTILKHNVLIVPVSFADRVVYMYEFDLQKILQMLVISPKIPLGGT